MVALYRLKGLGWLSSCALVAIGFYLVSSQVAAERKRLQQVDVKIASAERDIRALETEFDVRANLVQLERWNGNTLALTVPTTQQFVRDETTLASLSPRDMTPLQPGQSGGVQTASLIVPSSPLTVAPPAATSNAAPTIVKAVINKPVSAPRYDAVRIAQVVPATPAARPASAVAAARVLIRQAIAHADERPRVDRNVRSVAMVDNSLLSAGTLGDLASGARAERSRLR
ncbi:hypothetical protein SAMN05216382_2036 [Sphingomonas palmae]|uniref:Uncharacterized protein n=1 Tax=Sphingomonas palmae TaxID=1855283 RepID=A0A1H7Q640_9SPHN|nr:hypothetical protein [Sphingomonas palmae]SEL43134.1 hypothetical protein SAMN05216382_2036 [Sphingomonas palmae]